MAELRYGHGVYLNGLNITMRNLVQINGVPWDIETWHLSDTSLEMYRHTNQVDETNIVLWLQQIFCCYINKYFAVAPTNIVLWLKQVFYCCSNKYWPTDSDKQMLQ